MEIKLVPYRVQVLDTLTTYHLVNKAGNHVYNLEEAVEMANLYYSNKWKRVFNNEHVAYRNHEGDITYL